MMNKEKSKNPIIRSKNWIVRCWKDFIKTINSIYLCIRFPFLYPRNRFSGKHYTNWKITDYARNLAKQYNRLEVNKPTEKVYNLKIYTFDNLGSHYHYWVNWWSKPLYDVITWYHDNILQIFHCIPTYTELDGMPRGWRKAFGIKMCEEIKAACKEAGILHTYHILDIKEKYGMLRWYDDGCTEKINNIINRYEELSYKTCIQCGKPAEYITQGWISPYCGDCCPPNQKYSKNKIDQ